MVFNCFANEITTFPLQAATVSISANQLLMAGQNWSKVSFMTKEIKGIKTFFSDEGLELEEGAPQIRKGRWLEIWTPGECHQTCVGYIAQLSLS